MLKFTFTLSHLADTFLSTVCFLRSEMSSTRVNLQSLSQSFMGLQNERGAADGWKLNEMLYEAQGTTTGEAH